MFIKTTIIKTPSPYSHCKRHPHEDICTGQVPHKLRPAGTVPLDRNTLSVYRYWWGYGPDMRGGELGGLKRTLTHQDTCRLRGLGRLLCGLLHIVVYRIGGIGYLALQSILVHHSCYHIF